MVIKALINAWRSRGVMHHMYDELMEMLKAGEHMFGLVGKVLFEGVNPDEVANELYSTDIRINKTERKIRRQIVEHLAIHPGGDVPACLVLMSIVKDAERIGDYCKNLFEVRSKLGKGLSGDDFDIGFDKVHAAILDTFAKTQESLVDGDEDIAKLVTDIAKDIAHDLDDRVAAVAEATDVNVKVAVCRALSLRYMKRVHAHLCNIASSVVQPVHKIDYLDEGPLRPSK
jgi:phosphate transport system protein